jgi:hypothetical protein
VPRLICVRIFAAVYHGFALDRRGRVFLRRLDVEPFPVRVEKALDVVAVDGQPDLRSAAARDAALVGIDACVPGRRDAERPDILSTITAAANVVGY